MTLLRVETGRPRAAHGVRPSQASQRRVHPEALAGVSACGPLTTVVAVGCVSIKGEGRSATRQIAEENQPEEGDEP
jgi:hypothetical protein